MTQTSYYSAIATKQKIDVSAGIISGVSVITEGEAQGKNEGTFIDRTTLSQIRAIAGDYPDGVKVKLSESKEHDGSAGQIVGTLKNFRIDEKQLRADLHLLKASKKFEFILEMAQTMPSEFGLSVVIPKEMEKIGDREFLRCSEIYSVDIVESPAANKGLFSSKTNENSMTIKYAKGDSGDHAKDCECKECMSKHSKKEMTAMFAKLVGLDPDKATEADVETAFKASRGDTSAIAALTQKIADAETKLTKFESANADALKLAKKTEIDNLVVEANRDGKVIPLTDVQLSKMDVADIREMITKLPKGQVALSRRPVVQPKTADGKVILDKNSPEFKAWLSAKREEGAVELGRMMLSQQTGTN